jgi:hypothetical protein
MTPVFPPEAEHCGRRHQSLVVPSPLFEGSKDGMEGIEHPFRDFTS